MELAFLNCEVNYDIFGGHGLCNFEKIYDYRINDFISAVYITHNPTLHLMIVELRCIHCKYTTSGLMIISNECKDGCCHKSVGDPYIYPVYLEQFGIRNELIKCIERIEEEHGYKKIFSFDD
jgi:hypothetical protein